MTTNDGERGPGKRAAQIARRIETDIIRRGWPAGASLGSEQELQQHYRVSRSVLREAVRLVEHHQVARMRRGRGGGLVIAEPDAAPATRAAVIYLEYRGVTIDDLLAARFLLEPLTAALAAERIDEAGIERLREPLVAEVRNEFHLALAECAKNPVLELFVDMLTRLTARYVDGVPQLRGEHSDIVAAVTAGDAARAKMLSERHVASVTAALARNTTSSRHRQPGFRPKAVQGKLAEGLAASIQDDIAGSGWRVGSVLGGEAQLLQRYRVSRSVFREAVRLLEYHGVAQMRRGPGGGLVVAEPQAQASTDTIALYLQYRKPDREDLRVVRQAIEIDNVAKVVTRRTDGGVRAFLDSYRCMHNGIADDLPEAAAAESSFHISLAKLAGNAVLELLLRILIELFRRHWASPTQQLPSLADIGEIDHAHQRIAEAILDGDESLARYRTRRHLDAVAAWWQ